MPRFANVDDVVALAHGYGCGAAIDAPDAIVPIRTLRNISLNSNFGGEVIVVSLGCEKLQLLACDPCFGNSVSTAVRFMDRRGCATKDAFTTVSGRSG